MCALIDRTDEQAEISAMVRRFVESRFFLRLRL